MNRKLALLLALAAVVLAALAVLLTTSRYSAPSGAATGQSGGCGAETLPPDSMQPATDAGPDAPDKAEAPAQVVYRTFLDGKECSVITVEPLDGVATLDDLCGENPGTRSVDIDNALAKQVLDGYFALSGSPCEPGACPPGQRVEVLTVSESKRILPYETPLRETMEKILALAKQQPLPTPDEADAGEKTPAATLPAMQLTLKPEQGAVFANGAVTAEASPLKVDLICYASSKSVDLQAGAGPTMAKQKHLKLFRTPGGTVAKFGGLADLPDELPGEADRDMVHHADAGMGFVVENNISPGHTRIFVKNASKEAVTLEYQVVAW